MKWKIAAAVTVITVVGVGVFWLILKGPDAREALLNSTFLRASHQIVEAGPHGLVIERGCLSQA